MFYNERENTAYIDFGAKVHEKDGLIWEWLPPSNCYIQTKFQSDLGILWWDTGARMEKKGTSF